VYGIIKTGASSAASTGVDRLMDDEAPEEDVRGGRSNWNDDMTMDG